MIERLRRAHTPSARLDLMTLVASQPLRSIVFRMTETNTKSRFGLRWTNITFLLMACATRGNVAPIRLRPRRMTTKTVCMRIKSYRNRERDSTARRPMTTRTIQTARALVASMIKAHSKTRKPWKWFYRSGLHVCMADRANRMSGICELLRMTARARCVVRSSRHCRSRRTRISAMAQETRQSRVVRVVMFELRKICIRVLRKNSNRANNKERPKASREKSAGRPNQSCIVLLIRSWPSESH